MTVKTNTFLKILAGVAIFLGFAILILFVFKLGNLSFSVGSNLSLLDIKLNSYIGEFVGGLTGTFWALAGVILFYLAIRLQSQELNDTREQFKDQQFDNSFFNLMKTQNDIRNSLQLEGNFYENGSVRSKKTKSLTTFGLMYNNLKWIYYSLDNMIYQDEAITPNRDYTNNMFDLNIEYEISEDHWPEINNAPDREKAITAYSYLFNKRINQLGHYFRHLYNILEFIEKYAQKKNEKEKEEITNKYSQFIQAQLSNSELALLFYNGLKFDKMYDKICKFNLIENLPKEELIKEEHIKLYPLEIKSKNDA